MRNVLSRAPPCGRASLPRPCGGGSGAALRALALHGQVGTGHRGCQEVAERVAEREGDWIRLTPLEPAPTLPVMLPSLAHPISRPIAIADPQAALAALAPLPHPFLLHSALEVEGARWSFFGADPFAIDRGERYEEAAAAWRRIAQRFPTEAAPATSAPFTGGMVGYWAYDFGRRLERIPAVARDDLGLPDFVLGLYDVVGAFDHASGEAWLFSSGLPLAGPEARRRAEARGEEFARRIEGARAPGRGAPAPEGNHAPG